MRIAVVLTCLMLMALPARAEDYRFTAEQLDNMCASSANLDYGYCAGYVTAVADEMMQGSVGEYSACNHSNVKSQQYMDIFRAYIAAHPEARQLNADLVVAASYARAFPCKQ